MHPACHHSISTYEYRIVYESRTTNNIRSYADTFGFFVVMKTWRNLLLNISREW